MNRKSFLVVLLILSLVSIVLAQNSADNIFVPVRQIGSLRPSGIQYDANFDRFVMVDLSLGKQPSGVLNPEVFMRPEFQQKWKRLRK